ncbi:MULTISPECIES: hypothetical protein [Derxia]|uniref:Uncharacterized protein n=1 Tax=Derxia gummosa DSM 723 TaxID=1121388 RepID=A0A8B6X3B4_9BURK|nr:MULTISPECIES: hypothetical protein [Derxia]
MDRSLLEPVVVPALAFVGIAVWRARHPRPGERMPGWGAAAWWAIGMAIAVAVGVAAVGAIRSSDGWAAFLPLLLALGAYGAALVCLAGLTWVVIAQLFGREPPPVPAWFDEDDDAPAAPPPEPMAARLARLRQRSKAPSPLDRGTGGAATAVAAPGWSGLAGLGSEPKESALAVAGPDETSAMPRATVGALADGPAPSAGATATVGAPAGRTVRPMPVVAGPLDHLSWFAVLATLLLMTIGLGKGVLDALRSGYLRLGRRSAGMLFSQSPVRFGLTLTVMVAFAVGLLLLSMLIWRDGPALLAQRAREQRLARMKAEYRRRPTITLPAALLRLVLGGLAMLAFAPFARLLSALVGPSFGGGLAGLWNLVFLCWIGHGFWRLRGRR